MVYKSNPEKRAVKEKIAKVKETIEEMKNYKTVALLNLQKLPDSLLQSLRKRIRDDGGSVKILRKAVITRVLASDPRLKEKVSECEKPVALVLTNWSPYQLNRFLKESYKKRAAKAGETAPSDIVVLEGETDLPPGPALSGLKAGGVNVQIKGGKIVVAKDSVVAKAGDKITTQKAKALQTLGVMPFETRARLIFGFDGEYSYSKEMLDMGDTLDADLRSSLRDAFNLSVNADYPTPLNAEYLLTDAFRQALNAAVNGELYSIVNVDELLLNALRQGKALSDATPKEEKPAEEKKEEAPKEEAPKAEEKPKEEPEKMIKG